MKRVFSGALCLLFAPLAAHSQAQLSVYGSAVSVREARVSGDDPGGLGAFSFFSQWRESASSPGAGYGVRFVWWQDAGLGWGVDLSQATAHADTQTLQRAGLSRLEFGRKTNTLTVNAFRRWQPGGLIEPYIGAGVGLSIPQVTFETSGGLSESWRISGPAVQFFAGAQMPLSDSWSVFGEYKHGIVSNHIHLANNGRLNTILDTDAVNLGVSFGF